MLKIFSFITGIGRMVTLWVLILFYIITSLIGNLIYLKDLHKQRLFFSYNTSRFSRLILSTLGITVHVESEGTVTDSGCMFISNHLSYLDILVLSSIRPALYITSVEVRHTFFLGFMAKLGGSSFVERRNYTTLKEDIKEISEQMKQGTPYVLFPEGTSSNGTSVLPFKSSLFEVAYQNSSIIQPVCIKYTSINNFPIDETNRDKLYYYGDIEFFNHIMTLPFVGSATVRVSHLEQLNSKDFKNRKELSHYVYDKVITKYKHSA